MGKENCFRNLEIGRTLVNNVSFLQNSNSCWKRQHIIVDQSNIDAAYNIDQSNTQIHAYNIDQSNTQIHAYNIDQSNTQIHAYNVDQSNTQIHSCGDTWHAWALHDTCSLNKLLCIYNSTS